MPPTSNTEILARLDILLASQEGVKVQVTELKTLVCEMEDKRQAFRQEYDTAKGETAKIIAVLDHRLTFAERQIEADKTNIKSLTQIVEALGRSVDNLRTILNIIVGIVSFIGTGVGLWLLGRFLGLL